MLENMIFMDGSTHLPIHWLTHWLTHSPTFSAYKPSVNTGNTQICTICHWNKISKRSGYLNRSVRIKIYLFIRIRTNILKLIHTDGHVTATFLWLPFPNGKGRSEVARFWGWYPLSFQHLSNMENHPNGEIIILSLMPSVKLFKN